MTQVSTIASGRGPYTQTHKIIAASAVIATAPADTNENVLATVTLPAGIMGPNGIVRITTLWTVTNSANAKTLKVYFGGLGGTTYLSVGLTAVASYQPITMIRNRNSVSSQVGSPDAATASISSSTDGVTTSSINTASAVDIVITGTKASAGETISLESYLVELICAD